MLPLIAAAGNPGGHKRQFRHFRTMNGVQPSAVSRDTTYIHTWWTTRSVAMQIVPQDSNPVYLLTSAAALWWSWERDTELCSPWRAWLLLDNQRATHYHGTKWWRGIAHETSYQDHCQL